jgi:hypothetical protein
MHQVLFLIGVCGGVLFPPPAKMLVTAHSPNELVLGAFQPTSEEPRLGAPVSAFVARFGQPANPQNTLIHHFLGCSPPKLRYEVSPFEGYVSRIGGWACDGEKFVRTSAKAAAAPFMPRDAKLVRRFTTFDGWPGELFVSASVGRRFPADLFFDAVGRAVPRGTFYFVFDPDEGLQWSIGVGANP